MNKVLIRSIFVCLVMLTACTTTADHPEPTETLEVSDPNPECMDAARVVVWSDVNGDGVRAGDEPLLAGARLMLVPRAAPTSGGLEAETSEDGIVYFAAHETPGCDLSAYQVLFIVQYPGHDFPASPVISLEDFGPNNDTFEFALIPSGE